MSTELNPDSATPQPAGGPVPAASHPKDERQRKPNLPASSHLPYPPLANDIIHAVYKSMELLRADHQLLSFIGSWNETLSDEDVLAGLRFWIKLKRRELRRRQKTSAAQRRRSQES